MEYKQIQFKLKKFKKTVDKYGIIYHTKNAQIVINDVTLYDIEAIRLYDDLLVFDYYDKDKELDSTADCFLQNIVSLEV